MLPFIQGKQSTKCVTSNICAKTNKNTCGKSDLLGTKAINCLAVCTNKHDTYGLHSHGSTNTKKSSKKSHECFPLWYLNTKGLWPTEHFITCRHSH